MIINILKRKWIKEDNLNYLKNLSDQFRVYITKHNYDIIPINYVTGRECFVKSLNINFMERCEKSYTINTLSDMDYHIKDIFEFIKEHEIKNAPKKEKLLEYQEKAIEETKKIFNINNNIDNLQSQITFHLNDYTESERMDLFSYLSLIDNNCIDAIITLDFSKANLEKLENNAILQLMSISSKYSKN